MEPFPRLDQDAQIEQLSRPSTVQDSNHAVENRPASSSISSSSIGERLRRVSTSFEQSELPGGFFAATGGIASSILSRQPVPRPISDSIGSSSTEAPPAALCSTAFTSTPCQAVSEETGAEARYDGRTGTQTKTSPLGESVSEPASAAAFANGYHFPPKHSFGESVKLSALAFWRYLLTPMGFAVTVYGLNVVAWGGMLFLLLCNAAPAMCHPTCNDINSPRRIWIEIDSQILNALFCVTGFGLAPWRFRDLHFLLQYRFYKKMIALRRLAGIHRGWFRLRGSNELPLHLGPRNVGQDEFQSAPRYAIPFPEIKVPEIPLTGVRARPTVLWKLDLVIWLMVSNTFLQCALAGLMWGMNRYNRPGWATGLLIALGCVVAGAGGLIMFLEGKVVKRIEGVPVSEKDLARLQQDREKGVWHFNNIKDKNERRRSQSQV
ncbi:alpha-L-rhamnosidase C [Metarhizium guizhouense ARSEF 977]|uniref:Alpha-L-rhamnosidase C n=1 Tax=Metarhizium guizhouense (strain ARSEF 977) TaxID=1276136 RepID=A0A0B4GWJ6_METGA|nr:alpha-L-rhamnosidase C [Metarhizium guizhouense ARSEF 977]